MSHASCNQDNQRAIGRSLVSEWKTETGTSLLSLRIEKDRFFRKRGGRIFIGGDTVKLKSLRKCSSQSWHTCIKQSR
ncbi:hypothetical protein NC652_011153 [Populus alba x Populus x berolinensis]|uniref:Uncharacterized protein n=1 Tax=Populus alba x Populus x berolinensis TaxID=444605 RepID=A0AAD6R1P8_9ROSI|nr:hypothetical protein NC652_011153 [Populus alba x Populus x berolinensis]KAJ7000686.1 hypothetical protein NC653_011210 [Populus alba x Populus x berolinensis]